MESRSLKSLKRAVSIISLRDAFVDQGSSKEPETEGVKFPFEIAPAGVEGDISNWSDWMAHPDRSKQVTATYEQIRTKIFNFLHPHLFYFTKHTNSGHSVLVFC